MMKKIELLKKLGFSDLYLQKFKVVEESGNEYIEITNPIVSKNISNNSEDVFTVIINEPDDKLCHDFIYRN